MPRIVGVIPARMGSSRFPGKPLAPILGLPMIEHVYRRAIMWFADVNYDQEKVAEQFCGRMSELAARTYSGQRD